MEFASILAGKAAKEENVTMAWQLDTKHSQIEFSVKHMMVSTVRGHFTAFTGELVADEAHPENSRIAVTIDPTSIHTGDANRDGHLRAADFFEVEKYPEITYKSTGIELKGDEEFRLLGELTMHGVTQELPLDVTLEGQSKDMQGNRRAGFSAHTAISRKDFGLNWNVALETGGVLVSDKVNIQIDAELVETAPVTAEATVTARA